MSEAPTPHEISEPATGPVLTPPPAAVTPPPLPPQTVYVQQPSRLNKAAAWVGIVAGAVFIVAVIFGSGFIVGKNVGADREHHRGTEMVMRPAAPMFPMPPRGEFSRGPGFPGPFGPGGPMIELRPPVEPGGPTGPGGANPGAPGGSGQQPR